MKRTLLILALLPLGACDVPPSDGEIEEVTQAAYVDPGMVRPSRNPPQRFEPPVETFINFDTSPTGAPIANQSIIDTTYAALGVTFSCVACTPNNGNGSAYANTSVATATTSNAVAPSTGPALFDQGVGVVRAEFGSPRRYVSIEATRVATAADFSDTSPARPWLRAFDANGNMIMETYWSPSGARTQVLLVSDSSQWARIKSVQFSSLYYSPGAFGSFDNLRFDGN